MAKRRQSQTSSFREKNGFKKYHPHVRMYNLLSFCLIEKKLFLLERRVTNHFKSKFDYYINNKNRIYPQALRRPGTFIIATLKNIQKQFF